MAIDPKVFKQVRKALGLTQEELADAIGLSRVTINKMERGRLARGIPDEIANRLLALKAKPVAKGPQTVNLAFKDVIENFYKGVDKSDDHLWDNEEEEDQ